MAELTAVEQEKAKSFILDLFICAGAVKNSRSLDYSEENTMLNSSLACNKDNKMAANFIKEVIMKKQMKLNQVDSYLNSIVNSKVQFGNTIKSTLPEWTPADIKELAQYLAWFCKINKLYWDDRAYTVAERSGLMSDTYFGEALAEYKRFISQRDIAKSKSDPTPSSAGSTSTPSTPPIKGKKPSIRDAGPQSANCIGLISKSGEKEYPTGVLYTIRSSKTPTRTTPHVFIHPLNNPAYRERARVRDGKAKIYYGTGQAWTDMEIFTSDRSLMEAILAQLKAQGLDKHYPGMDIVAAKGDPKGYYRIATEAGEMYIRPVWLNETVEEDLDTNVDEIDETLYENSGVEINDIDTFAKYSRMYD